MDPAIKAQVLRKMTYGMWVLTAAAGDDLEGSTVTWVSQASFTPPLLMVGIRAGTHLHEVVEKSGAFALHLLEADQKEIAGGFTKPTKVGGGQIGGFAFRKGASTGSPILERFSSWLEARVTDVVKRGDHSVFIAEVVGAGMTDPSAKPLELSSTPWYYGG